MPFLSTSDQLLASARSRDEILSALALLEVQVREILGAIAVARASGNLDTASQGGRVLIRLMEARVALAGRLAQTANQIA